LTKAGAEELSQAKTSGDVVVVGFFADETSSEFQAFKAAANALRNDFDFRLVTSSELAKAEGVKFPALVIFRKFDEPSVKFDGELKSEDILKFIKSESLPSFGEIGPDNYQKYVERGFPIIWHFLDYKNEDSTLLSAIQAVAKKFKQVSFVKLDGLKWASHAKNFGLTDLLPGIVLEDREKRKNYLLPEGSISEKSLSDWVQEWVDGKLHANIKSQEIPEPNDEAVKVIVGKTFDTVVNDKTKDVLVEFYAPWCGHCKTLAPKYEELAVEFQEHPSVVIAKVDATENDTPADIKGFPTLILYPSNDKKKSYNFQRRTQ